MHAAKRRMCAEGRYALMAISYVQTVFTVAFLDQHVGRAHSVTNPYGRLLE